ncbi:heavy-metal-associated domain-containing protein [Miniimonas arenae]|uniref:heavy-metal-associated domain-containing protein n=1 Tax=Miniimonas arenae TaxID=676201 RepID=UPI0028AA0727|nr:heavy-metal-associated domain-containing protein [Miniimonas arenae]
MSTTLTTLDVTGMTCGHCVSAVTKELETVDGVTRVSVELHNGGTSRVTLLSSEPLPEDALRSAIDEAGYDVTGVDVRTPEEEFAQLADAREEVYGTADGGQGPQRVELTTREAVERGEGADGSAV